MKLIRELHFTSNIPRGWIVNCILELLPGTYFTPLSRYTPLQTTAIFGLIQHHQQQSILFYHIRNSRKWNRKDTVWLAGCMSLSASLIWIETFTDWFFVSSFGPYKRVSQLGSAITLIFGVSVTCCLELTQLIILLVHSYTY